MATGRNPGIRVPAPNEAHPGVIAAIQQIIKEFGWQASPTFAGIGISGFGTAGFVKNTAAGVLSGGNTLAVSDLPVHDLVGSQHGAAGLTTGHVVRASGATTFAWAQLSHSDLGSVGASDHHAPVTLATSADVLLGLTGQQLALDTQAATYVLAGPATGGPAAPTFRALAATDIPALAYEASGAVATHAALTTGVHGLAITAGQTLTVTAGGTLGSAAYTASTAYDATGTAAGLLSGHTSTYDHTLLHSPVTLGTANGLTLSTQELSLPTTATPTLGKLTIAATTAISLLNMSSTATSGVTQMDVKSDTYTGIYLQSSGSAINPFLAYLRSRGTVASPTALQNGDNVAEFYAQGYQAGSFISAAGFRWTVDAVPITGLATLPGRLIMATSSNGQSFAERIRVTSGGYVGVNATAPSEILEVGGNIVATAGVLGPVKNANTAMVSGYGWTATNDCTLVSNRAQWTFSGGLASTLTQSSTVFCSSVIAGRSYRLSYFVSSAAGAPAATITTAIASMATALTLTNGTRTTNFTAAAVPGDLVISATLTAGQVFYLDNISLQEISDGNVSAGTKFIAASTPGISTTFLDNDGNTITVTGGIITAKTAP